MNKLAWMQLIMLWFRGFFRTQLIILSIVFVTTLAIMLLIHEGRICRFSAGGDWVKIHTPCFVDNVNETRIDNRTSTVKDLVSKAK